VEDRGLELIDANPEFAMGLSELLDTVGAESGARDADLQFLNDLWPALSAEVKATILGFVQDACE
jgi:hypothetical protein